MKRTTVKLPDDLDAKLRHEAARRQSTVADITREAPESHLGGRTRRKLLAAKAGRSGTMTRLIRSRTSFARRPQIALMVDSGPLYSYSP